MTNGARLKEAAMIVADAGKTSEERACLRHVHQRTKAMDGADKSVYSARAERNPFRGRPRVISMAGHKGHAIIACELENKGSAILMEGT